MLVREGIKALIFVCLVALGIPICCGQNIRAVKEDGRGLTIWDTFAHSVGKVLDSSNADVANNQYHLYSDDVQLMKDMGMDAYRFSISWSRIYPNGTGEINQAGIDHYNNLINALLAQGNNDKVKYWITFNEPHTVAVQGYDVGLQAPSRCSILLGAFCRAGNSASEPYTVGHNMLLSHAIVVDIYKKKYKPKQQGSIGITLDSFWYEPATNSSADIQATQRAIDFNLGWFIEPLIVGDYPKSMRSRVGSRLPRFSPAQSNLLKGSFDFIGINHYTTWFAKENTTNIIGVALNDTLADSGTFTFPFVFGKPIPDRANSVWLYIVPHGIRSLMNYIRQKYGNPLVLITENGMDDGNSPLTSIKDALKDKKRIKYHNDYLTNLLAAIKEDGCNVRGYFSWSLLDNWEWGAGFSSRFGLYYVDYNDKLRKRYAKDSVKWFKNFLAS
ncbi:hypothetical protein DH2020_032350 [Rehmannia glutinosa]|uniref:Beta-glucosidase n=1 Tax=Rehmannia glutinosa TaxID=99300 RepID=A0ABR0VIG6_REHGL